MMSSPITRFATLSALILAWMIGSPAAFGAAVITNLPNGTTGGTTLNNAEWKALLFSTGSNAWTIDNIVIGLNPLVSSNVPSSPKVELALYSVVAGQPSVQLATTGLQTVSITALQQSYTLTTSGFQLAANTPYALVVRSDAGAIKWGNTNPSTSPTASNGFSYTTFLASTDSGTSWGSSGISTVNAVQINATAAAPVPTMRDPIVLVLMAMFLLIVGFKLMRRDHQRVT
jgi:hypothetical protein